MDNLELGERLKREGMERAADKRMVNLRVAQFSAKSYAKRFDTCTADDATRHFTPAQREALGNAAGSIFKGPEWVHVGYTKSKRPSNHARVISIWRLK